MHRKLLLRRQLLAYARPGAAFVPFCGDGDISEMYVSDFNVFGADLDAARVATATARFPSHTFVVADCDRWPFVGERAVFTLGDFDAYSHPYASFIEFWNHARVAPRLVLFFTDGHRQGIIRAGVLIAPDGTRRALPDLATRRRCFHGYWARLIRPWFYGFVGDDWTVLATRFYVRGGMLYWGAAIEHRGRRP